MLVRISMATPAAADPGVPCPGSATSRGRGTLDIYGQVLVQPDDGVQPGLEDESSVMLGVLDPTGQQTLYTRTQQDIGTQGSKWVEVPVPVLLTQAGILTTAVAGVEHDPGHEVCPSRIPCATVAWAIRSKICSVVMASTEAPLPVK